MGPKEDQQISRANDPPRTAASRPPTRMSNAPHASPSSDQTPPAVNPGIGRSLTREPQQTTNPSAPHDLLWSQYAAQYQTSQRQQGQQAPQAPPSSLEDQPPWFPTSSRIDQQGGRQQEPGDWEARVLAPDRAREEQARQRLFNITRQREEFNSRNPFLLGMHDVDRSLAEDVAPTIAPAGHHDPADTHSHRARAPKAKSDKAKPKGDSEIGPKWSKEDMNILLVMKTKKAWTRTIKEKLVDDHSEDDIIDKWYRMRREGHVERNPKPREWTSWEKEDLRSMLSTNAPSKDIGDNLARMTEDVDEEIERSGLSRPRPKSDAQKAEEAKTKAEQQRLLANETRQKQAERIRKKEADARSRAEHEAQRLAERQREREATQARAKDLKARAQADKQRDKEASAKRKAEDSKKSSGSSKRGRKP